MQSPIQLSEVRGLFLEGNRNFILLNNGMKVAVSHADAEKIKEQLVAEAKAIKSHDKKWGFSGKST